MKAQIREDKELSGTGGLGTMDLGQLCLLMNYWINTVGPQEKDYWIEQRKLGFREMQALTLGPRAG